ncbi:MAG TPA: TonB-dependent receptor [Draconibacterium sp.]|nr:TonB-dependent receptor [Draconibacterium sp.]
MSFLKIFSTVIFIFSSFTLFAQKGTVSGKVIDSVNGQPLEYASVAVYNATDSMLINGTITNGSGNFKIEKLKSSLYYIRVQFLGYETMQTRSFEVINEGETSLGDLKIQPSAQMMEEISVSGNRANSSNKLEKQSYSASQFESAKGGTAIDVLKNMPSIAVNGQGEVTVRGSSGFLVLVNGKPVLTDVQTALGQIPANMLSNVELITSPTAKYDPDGKAGIINITTKKGAADGKSLIVNGQYGFPSTTDYNNLRVAKRYGADVMFNQKTDKWDISLGANYNRNDINGFREGKLEIKNYENNRLSKSPSNGERSFNRYNYAGRANITFNADENNVLSFGLFAGKRYQERDANLFYNNSEWTLDTNEKISQFDWYNANKQVKEGTFTLGNLDYTHTFKDTSALTFSVLYEYDNLTGNTFNKNLTEPGGEMIQYVENPYKKPINGYRLKLDYAKKIGKGKFEAGYQFRYDSQDGVFDYLVIPEIPNDQDIDKFRGTALSRNQINSAYTQYSAKSKKLEYNFGLRYEYSQRDIELSFDPEIHVLNLSNFFPSANALYYFTDDLKLKAGYSRRIQRATNNQLNPIPEREHSETLEIGDPDLKHEFVDLAELGLIKSFEDGGSVFLTAYYMHGKNPMQRVNSVFNDTILYRVYTNVESSQSVGVETGLDWNPTKWWEFYLGANVYKQKYSGDLKIFDNPVINVNNSGWVYSLNLNTTFSLSSTLSLNANVNYLSKRPTAQGEDSRFLTPNLALKKSFKDNRYSLSLQWQYIDLGMHQSNRQRITTWGDDFYTSTNYIYETDIILLNFSYNLNWKNGKSKLPSSEFGEKEF